MAAEFEWSLSPGEDPPFTSLFRRPTNVSADVLKDGKPYIAVIEDNAADVDLLRYALAGAHVETALWVLADGEQALNFVDQVTAGTVRCPSLFVLDLNLPKRSGGIVLQRIRQSSMCKEVPVVVLSSSAAERDKQEASRLGANRYMTKPSELDGYLEIGEVLAAYLKG
jgi:CheY-like chemotaxis protein